MTVAEETVVPPSGTSCPGGPAGGGSTTSRAGQVTVSADLKPGYQFLVDFGTAGMPGLLMDEPEPLGGGQGPVAWRAICAAAASMSPPGLTATALAPDCAPSRLGPPLRRLRLM